MKRTPIKRVGKIGRRNAKANSQLKALFANREITSCEVCRVLKILCTNKLPCLQFQYLSFAHRHKRVEYRKYPHKLADFNQVVLACQHGHQLMERDAELTEKVFKLLRGEDTLSH